MTKNIIDSLLDTRRRVVKAVERGELSVEDGANLLGITRQGLWKIRKRVRQFGYTQGAPTLIFAIDDHTRQSFADLYRGNSSANAAKMLRRMVISAPFKIQRVRTDN